MYLVRTDGQAPSRLVCALRGAIFWGPMCVATSLSVWLGCRFPELDGLAFILWLIGLVMLLCHVVVILCLPSRSLHDLLTDTYLVPR